MNLLPSRSLQLREVVAREAEAAAAVVAAEKIAEGVVLAVHEVARRAADRAVRGERQIGGHALPPADAGAERRSLADGARPATRLVAAGEGRLPRPRPRPP